MATEKETYLYKIESPNNRIYIGQTVSPKNRFAVYKRCAIPAQHKLRESIKKYGWDNHTVNIITKLPSKDADEVERYLIAYYDSIKNGLNILPGGKIKTGYAQWKKQSYKMKGRKQPQEFKDMISKIMKGNKHAKGCIRTEEFKRNLSVKNKGIKRTSDKYKHPKPYLNKPVLSFDLNGRLLKEYKKLSDVVLDGFDKTCVSRVCLNLEGRKKHKNVVFKFKENG